MTTVVVRRVGLEPTSPHGQQSLSLPCMPIPAPPQASALYPTMCLHQYRTNVRIGRGSRVNLRTERSSAARPVPATALQAPPLSENGRRVAPGPLPLTSIRPSDGGAHAALEHGVIQARSANGLLSVVRWRLRERGAPNDGVGSDPYHVPAGGRLAADLSGCRRASARDQRRAGAHLVCLPGPRLRPILTDERPAPMTDRALSSVDGAHTRTPPIAVHRLSDRFRCSAWSTIPTPPHA